MYEFWIFYLSLSLSLSLTYIYIYESLVNLAAVLLATLHFLVSNLKPNFFHSHSSFSYTLLSLSFFFFWGCQDSYLLLKPWNVYDISLERKREGTASLQWFTKWIMGCGDGKEFNVSNSFTGLKLRPLIPKPMSVSPILTPLSCDSTHYTNLFSLNHHPGICDFIFLNSFPFLC